MNKTWEKIARTTADPAQALAAVEELHREFGASSPLKNPVRSAALLRVMGNSNFLRRWARRQPEALREILESDFLQTYSVHDYLHDLHRELKTRNPSEPDAWADFLIAFKYRHFFRITFQDVGLSQALESIMAQLSDLALAISQTALHTLEAEIERESGLPLTLGASPQPIPFTVMALGKLGGGELNFSSDIDLIYFYGSDAGQVTGKVSSPKPTPHEYFTKLSQRLTRFLGKKTANGFLYRVDLDLRPEGKAGVLAGSLDSMETYYENFGASWERQALIKAAHAAGSIPLFHAFQQKVEPFVYPKNPDFTFLRNLLEMKAKILAGIRASGDPWEHLKLGDGGIREVEFFVQSLQLLYGGKNPTLRNTNTLEALRRLADLGLVRWDEEERLRQAYLYLRTMEHRLQLAEEEQTHRIPASAEERVQLARRMGLTDPDPEAAVEQMFADLKGHRSFVQATFQELLSHRFEESA
jgi:glutamate-ammonia-ligase adenylyltransferase